MITLLAVVTLLFQPGAAVGQEVIEYEEVKRAPSLAGVVTLALSGQPDPSAPMPNVTVEEWTPRWGKRLSSVKTDGRGRFKISRPRRSGVHYLVFELRGFKVLRLKVSVEKKAAPLYIAMVPD